MLWWHAMALLPTATAAAPLAYGAPADSGGGAPCRRIGRIGDRQHSAAVGGLIGKHHHFPQKTLREALAQCRSREQVLERDPIQFGKASRFVSELAGRKVGKLPKLGLRAPPSLLGRLAGEHSKTILMVTHDPLAAERARVVLHLEKGVLVDTVTAGRAR